MDPPFDTSLTLARHAKLLGKIVAWDPGIKSELRVKGAKDLLQRIDYLIANESECENLTGMKKPAQAARRLIKENEKLKVVTKLGSRGATLHSEKKRVSVKCLDLEKRRMKVVNTVGCGDAFLGAFVAALSEGRVDEEALRWGNCAGGLKATRQETRGSPNRETLLKNLQ
jgi:ribokinase